MESNSVYNAIMARRSIRSFQDKPVSRDIIRTLLEAAMAAPSACNLQPWEFIVVDDPETLKNIRETAAPGSYGAPLMIVICGTAKHIPWGDGAWLFDVGAAAQNILLECVEQGLGSVCEGAFEDDKLREVLDIPEDVDPAIIIEIGYPAVEKIPHTWYDEKAVSWQKFDRSKNRVMRTMEMLQDDMRSGLI